MENIAAEMRRIANENAADVMEDFDSIIDTIRRDAQNGNYETRIMCESPARARIMMKKLQNEGFTVWQGDYAYKECFTASWL